MLNALKTEILFSKGQKLANSAQYNNSIETFDIALSLSPKHSGLYLHKALILSKLSKHREALDVLKNAIKIKPKNPAYHFFHGIICYDNSEFDAAENAFDQTLTLCPQNTTARCFKYLIELVAGRNLADMPLSMISEHLKNTNLEFKSRLLLYSESLLTGASGAMPLDAAYFYNVYMLKESTGARRIISKIDRLTTNVFYGLRKEKRKAYHMIQDGDECLEKSVLTEAISNYRNALKVLPDCSYAFFKLLDIYFYQRAFDKFFEQLSSYAETREMFDHIQNAEGIELDDFLTSNHKSFEMYLPLLVKLAVYNIYIGQIEKALALLYFCEKKSGGDYYILYHLGLCYLSKMDSGEALEYFKKSLAVLNYNLVEARFRELIRINKLKRLF